MNSGSIINHNHTVRIKGEEQFDIIKFERIKKSTSSIQMNVYQQVLKRIKPIKVCGKGKWTGALSVAKQCN